MQRLFFLAIIIFYLPAFAQNTPQLFHVTTAATAPGETVLIRGEGIDLISKIEVGRLTDDRVDNSPPAYVPLPEPDHLPDSKGSRMIAGERMMPVDKIQQNEKSVKVIIPDALQQGVYCVRMTDNKGAVSGFYVNVPVVNWVISEDGYNAAAAGDILRIQGKNLFRKGGSGQVVLVSNGKMFKVKVDSIYDDYSVKVTLPATIQQGKYQLFCHNGLGGKTAWSTPLTVNIVNKAMWSTQAFNVKTYGAKGNGSQDDTEAFKKALTAAHDGGIVNVPAGNYILSEGLVIPNGVMVKGQKGTVINFGPVAAATLISGADHFGLTDLTIRASRALGIIMNSGDGHVILERLIVQQDIGNALAELDSKWNKTGIQLKGHDIRVRDCVFKTAGMFSFVGVSGFIQRCRFEKAGGSVKTYMKIHPQGLIFEDCYKQTNGYGYGATINESYDLYEARNVTPFNYINDREVMTLDGGSGGYFGKVGGASGNRISLRKDGSTFQWAANKWIGGGLFIIDGKGSGQFRRIVQHTMDQIELDEPFLVQPDTSSVISITTIRDHLFFVNNTATDAGAFQFYGSAQNCVIAGLKMQRSAGIIGKGSYVNYGRQPNWYIDIVDCELSDGTYTPQVNQKDRFRGDQQINIIGSGYSGLNIGSLVRRNVLSGKSYIRVSPGGEVNDVQDAIIERNKVSGAKNGLAVYGVGRVVNNLFIHDNQFGTMDIQKALKAEGYQVR
ncbi:glycosyl hydrolase family 28-related protein [Chitinophaga sp. LS1]|uniref:glycosyl hydrolase family 28-related protein n=1 Tax=Chitinophaga sp. LS1 TaxID=3051176 RepID=UPI002AABA384|nr:glycosyl hydrolase family 28-related protein [Chitinophaga sp. LS1]WPV67930.1 glycosyl hydrolase family 28-related protein [Chitinophaga sp. LS1]